jgi:hypothetical protein
LRRLLETAERLGDAAMRAGLFQVKMPWSRSRALLLRVTAPDQRFVARFFRGLLCGVFFAGFLAGAISFYLHPICQLWRLKY